MMVHAQPQRTFGMTMIPGEMDEQRPGSIRRKDTHPLRSLPLRS